MKIVINKCHGGFGVSPEAIKVLAMRKSSLIEEKDFDEYYKDSEWRDSDWKDSVDMGDGFHQSTGLGWHVRNGNTLFQLKDKYDNRNAVRTHKDLISLIEEKGSDFVSGEYAELAIVEIPDGVSFEISEYDGLEWVAETHRTWG